MLGIGRNGSALAIALATGAVLVGVGAGAEQASAQNGKKAKNPYSPEFQAAAVPLQAKLDAATAAQKAGGGGAAAKPQVDAALADAPAMLAQVEAVAKTPADKLAAGQLAYNLAILTNDMKLFERGARAMLASGALDAEGKAKVQAALTQVTSAPQADPVATAVETQMRANNPRGALAELRKASAARPAGQPMPAAYFARATQIAVVSKIPDEALYWSTQQVQAYPSNINWLAATQTLRQFVPMDPQGSIDLFRLMSRSGALNNEPRFVGNEYLTYADLANLRGYRSEAVRVVDQGKAVNALTGSQGVQIRGAASAKAAEERASAASEERSARAAADGIPAIAAADLYLSLGEAAKAEELYKLGLQKGGARLDKDRALTRQGIAQLDQGKLAEARDSFSKVAGSRQTLAKLWLILIDQKSAGTAPRAS